MWTPADMDPQALLRVVLMSPLFLFALTVHEFAHAWMAKRFGDSTAEEQGRLTLDPRAHIDPVGLVAFLLSALVGFGVGWAKPVPVTLSRCREPLKARFWIAFAGPLSNLLQAVCGLGVLVLLGFAGAPSASALLAGVRPIFEQTGLGLIDILACLTGYFVIINLVLMWFNLIPLLPLDGGQILISIAPHKLLRSILPMMQYGFAILLALMFFGALDYWFYPLMVCLGALADGLVALGFA